LPLFDASAVIDLWENYPIAQFPSVWDWFQREVAEQNVVTADVAYEEIGHKSPECKKVLQEFGVVRHGVGSNEVQHALAIKAEFGIQDDQYSSGVDENDIFIIAVAKSRGLELVTNEALQPRLPESRTKYRIPAVCRLPVANVTTMRLIEFIRQSNRVF